MAPPSDARRRRRNVVSAAVLLAGLAVALVIRLTATPPASSPLGNQADVSKKYLREMERFGGKANLMAEDFREWFDGLWHGRRLAGTIAVLSALGAMVLFVALTPLPPKEDRPTPRGAPPPAR